MLRGSKREPCKNVHCLGTIYLNAAQEDLREYEFVDLDAVKLVNLGQQCASTLASLGKVG